MHYSHTLVRRRLGGRDVLLAPLSGIPGIEYLPYSLRVVLENLVRVRALRGIDTTAQIDDLLARRVGAGLSFYPARIFGQDILGQVMLVDLAALRDALAAAGLDPSRVRPEVPVDIVIDHSLQVDVSGTRSAPALNLDLEYLRNQERFAFLRWCSASFPGVRVVPPGKGIMHQLHLERLAQVVWTADGPGGVVASPDTCVGVDSHTAMINALGVLGWGVGGLEAEAVMLGRPVAMALPRVVGVEVAGRLDPGVTTTDVVLALTEKLRALGVVDAFVELFGERLELLSVADRGTISNMAPEYGATAAYAPIDARTIDYLKMTGRPAEQIRLVEAYARAQKLWRDGDAQTPEFETVVTLALGDVRPCIAGPRNPEERIDLARAASAFDRHVRERGSAGARAPEPAVRDVRDGGEGLRLRDGDVVIAAITSCTNTSNPSGMVTAGLLARNAVRRGLFTRPWVKTSLAPGSHVVAAVLEDTGLQAGLDALGFHVIGFGCTTCNGGSGPLPPWISEAIARDRVLAAAVLSGNRNFQGRIHPSVEAAYLASPALVVAYAIAGSMRVDLTSAPLGRGADGREVLLRDVWPSESEIAAIVDRAFRPDVFRDKYADLFDGGARWDALAEPGSPLFPWRPDSAYVKRPPYFEGLSRTPPPIEDIVGARALAVLGDSITTDHISPSGAISLGTPAADYLLAQGLTPGQFNNYTTRRGNHEIIRRATFANIRLGNRMVPGACGGLTRLWPGGEVMRIFEAAEAYGERGTPLIVIAGHSYGCGSSRDSAAKGVALLGVKAVVARSFERIHRTNLVGMGVLPLELPEGVSAETLGLDGTETFDVTDLARGVRVRGRVILVIHRASGGSERVAVTVRLDTEEDVAYWRHGGILPAVWRERVGQGGDPRGG
ncbi:MAG TPA: aconitate hydratase AcnA [Kofleriaceae bacterium]|nr:aconitate hydratase AcnA [Kofleriaceae bacterium]